MFPQDSFFTVFDVETTGLDPKAHDRIVEIAGVRIEKGIVREDKHFVSLVNPERGISWEAKRINGIRDEDLKGAPLITEVLPHFLEFAEGTVLVAHNAEFDLSFLEVEKGMCWGYLDVPECICTLRLSRSVSPYESRHHLDAVAARMGLSPRVGHHRALTDVVLTAHVLLKLIEKGAITSLDMLRERGALYPASCR